MVLWDEFQIIHILNHTDIRQPPSNDDRKLFLLAQHMIYKTDSTTHVSMIEAQSPRTIIV